MYVTWYCRIIIEAENSDDREYWLYSLLKTYLLRLCKFAQLFCCFCTVSHSVSLLGKSIRDFFRTNLRTVSYGRVCT